MALNLNEVEARLTAMGLARLLSNLRDGPVPVPIHLPFASLKTAKGTAALLYRWLWFNPEVKSRVSLRVDEGTSTLVILPKAGPERRGRRGSK